MPQAEQTPEFRTVTSPLALSIWEAHGSGHVISLEDQRILRACLAESYTLATVRHRMKLLKEELREFLIHFEEEIDR